jgi:hypothetical protein
MRRHVSALLAVVLLSACSDYQPPPEQIVTHTVAYGVVVSPNDVSGYTVTYTGEGGQIHEASVAAGKPWATKVTITMSERKSYEIHLKAEARSSGVPIPRLRCGLDIDDAMVGDADGPYACTLSAIVQGSTITPTSPGWTHRSPASQSGVGPSA